MSLAHDTHATTSPNGGWSTKRIAVCALFCAISAVCTLFLEFPIMPGVEWLRYDPSGVVALLAGFSFGPAVGAIVSILPYFVHLGTSGGIYGTIMAILATFALVMPAALTYRKIQSIKGAIVGMAIGAIVCLVAVIVGNLVFTPLYSGMPIEAVQALILPVLVPFNVMKIALNCVLGGLLLMPVSKAISQA
ncbi:MAG: ECF transporter S component [Atopobiaceae bacterium]|jgi:riboflavin transporter FmnP